MRAEPYVQGCLFLLSAIAWVGTYFYWTRVQRWWYEAADKRFLKSPRLDVGLVFMMLLANLAALGLLVESKLLATDVGQAKPELLVSSGNQALDEAEISAGDTAAENESPNLRPTESRASWLGLLSRIVRGTLLLGFAVFASYWLYGIGIYQWGLAIRDWRRFWATVRASWLAFLLLVPPVLLLHALLQLLFRYQHERIHDFQIARDAGAWDLLAIIFISTAIWTPVVEELAFRSMIQGFIEQMVRCRANLVRWTLGPLRPLPAVILGLTDAARIANQELPEVREKPSFSSLTFWGPIVATSLLFALAHAGQGAAPIALYVFAMGLGFLYKTTGNLVLCILIHAYLNGLTLLTLLFG